MGSNGVAVVRALTSYQCGPGSNPGVDAICGLSLLLVLSFAPRGFSPGTLVFPSPQKTTFPKFQFDQESGRRRTTMLMCYLQIVILKKMHLNALDWLTHLQLTKKYIWTAECFSLFILVHLRLHYLLRI